MNLAINNKAIVTVDDDNLTKGEIVLIKRFENYLGEKYALVQKDNESTEWILVGYLQPIYENTYMDKITELNADIQYNLNQINQKTKQIKTSMKHLNKK